MAQLWDCEPIYTSMHQLHCRAVAQDVRRDTLIGQRWTDLLCHCSVLRDQMLNGVGASTRVDRPEYTAGCGLRRLGPVVDSRFDPLSADRLFQTGGTSNQELTVVDQSWIHL